MTTIRTYSVEIRSKRTDETLREVKVEASVPSEALATARRLLLDSEYPAFANPDE